MEQLRIHATRHQMYRRPRQRSQHLHQLRVRREQCRGQFVEQRYAFQRAYLTADGRPALQRYLTADYGFIRGDLAVNLLVFANQTARFQTEALR